MKDKMNFQVKGHLTITEIKDGEYTVIFDDSNALVPNYKNVIRRALGGEVGSIVNEVKALKASSVLATAPVTIVDYIALTDNEVKFTAVFNPASFNDTIDEVILSSSNAGDFSQVLGLSITKDNLTNLQVDWTLKIINQP